jgi:hypothetical protein
MDLLDVIDRLLAEIPPEEVDLRATLTDLKSSAAWAAPESLLLWWEQVYETLEEDVGDPTGVPWKEALVRIWTEAVRVR